MTLVVDVVCWLNLIFFELVMWPNSIQLVDLFNHGVTECGVRVV